MTSVMSALWVLLAKDLRQILWQWRALLYLLVLPAAFTAVFAAIYQGFAERLEPRLLIVLEPSPNDPRGTLAHLILEADPAIRLADSLESVDWPEAWTQLSPMESDSWQLEIGQQVREAEKRQLETLRARLELIEAMIEIQHGGQLPQAESQLKSSWQALESALPTFKLPEAAADPGQLEAAERIRLQASSGTMVQFVLFGLILGSTLILADRRQGTRDRMMMSPLPRSGPLWAHGWAAALTVALQQQVLASLGQLILGVPYFDNVGGFLLMVVSVALFAGALGVFIGVFAQRDDHVIAAVLVSMFLLAGLGGAWFPLDVAEPRFAALGSWLPSAWAMEGYHQAVRGLSVSELWPNAAKLTALAVLLFAVSAWKWHRHY